MELDTEKSGSRIFHQVKPSGRAGCSRLLKMVPGKSTQTHTLITTTGHALSVLSPQSKPLTVSPNTTSRRQCKPFTVHGQNDSVNPKAQILLPFSRSAPKEMFLPSSPLKSTTTAVIPETPTQASQSKTHSKKTVVVVPESKNFQIVEYAQSQEVHLFPSCAHPLTDTIRTFSKVSRLPHRLNSPTQRVVEDTGFSPNQSSEPSVILPAVVNKVLEVASNREQWNKDYTLTQANGNETDMTEKQPEFSVVMFDDKIFFRIKKKESVEGELMDLCCDEVLSRETDEDSVTFVCYTPAPAVSRVENRKGTCTETVQAPGGSSTTDSTQAVSSHRDGHIPRGHNPLPQISSGLTPAPCPVADHKLKQMFGITSEVEIRLPRMVSCDADVNVAFQVPPLDYTQPIEEDFVCAADPPHSQDCPKVEGSASRVGRTRKRTKCPCCSPAVLHRYHPTQKRRAKPGHGDRRETVRRQLKLLPLPITALLTSSVSASVNTPAIPQKQAKLQPTSDTTPMTTPFSTPFTIPVTTTVTTLQSPRKQAKLQPPPVTRPMTTPETTLETTPVTTAMTIPQIPRKPAKTKASPVSTSVTTAGTTAQIPRKKSKFLLTPSVTAPVATPQIPRKKAKLKPPLVSTPVTTPMSSNVTTSQIPQKQNKLTPNQLTASVTVLTTTTVTTPGTTAQMTDKDSEEMQIHKEIEVLREALRIKEAALERLKSDKNR